MLRLALAAGKLAVLLDVHVPALPPQLLLLQDPLAALRVGVALARARGHRLSMSAPLPLA
eukprot:1191786-Prorocentrum_minimum.AAC.1